MVETSGEKIVYGGNEIDICKSPSGGRYYDYSPRRYYMPDKATVSAKPSTPNWAGNKGITYFIKQHPPVVYSTEILYEREESTSLLGKAAHVRFDGFYYPPELPQILDRLEQWGWTVTPEVKVLVEAGKPSKP